MDGATARGIRIVKNRNHLTDRPTLGFVESRIRVTAQATAQVHSKPVDVGRNHVPSFRNENRSYGEDDHRRTDNDHDRDYPAQQISLNRGQSPDRFDLGARHKGQP
jgi:hypothetical protein